ncbi:unnamed protein product [Adineta steineri]|uniref:Uncharacterized protein n=1 Tax=Adineta steineri TaxID=433720 RepID=A0A814CTR6_9BILA|nr:unnamed protein product [Adineta steineri]
MVHFSQSILPDIPLATSLPTTFTFHPNNQMDEQEILEQQHQQQQSLPSSSQSQLNSSLSNQQQQQLQQQQQHQSSSSNDDGNSNPNHQTHTNDYETRLRCPNCETWVVNLSDHLRKTHRIASPVDRKPLLRMARLEKRRMAESANHSSPSTTTTTLLKTSHPSLSSTLVVNGLSSSQHTNTNEIENLLFKHEHDPNTLPNQQFSVTIPENILLNQQLTNSIAHYTSSIKRERSLDEHLEHTTNEILSPHKKSRIGMIDGTKLSQTIQSSSNKSSKKNRNKQDQQQQLQSNQTIIKTAASGIFPQQQQQQQQQQQLQQAVTLQNIDESSDDLSKVLQMMGNEMNFLNQHLQTTSILLQKQLDLARDSLHACSVQFAHLKRMIQQQI